MLRFRKFMVEYLTDEQRSRYAKTKMTEKARADTDHFFGKDNDIVHGQLSGSDHIHNKSEVHKAVEAHLGKPISHDEYRSGLTSDPKYPTRSVKLGKLIKDEKLRNDFASDKAREGSRMGNDFKTSTVRGTEVAGQTNSAKTKEHPNGHSWGNLSCKNVDDGVNRHYLKHEIAHGTVVHRVHDHNGQEIYRATLQPHHNDKGHVAYDVNSEYGIKHPAFTKSAHETAKKLSGEYKPGIFKIHPKVYDDTHFQNDGMSGEDGKGISTMLHPASTKEHIDKIFDSNFSTNMKKAAMKHPDLNSDHLHKALNDKNYAILTAAVKHPNLSTKNIDKALNHEDVSIRRHAASHTNVTKENIDKALNDKDELVRRHAVRHTNATKEHLDKALNDKSDLVRMIADWNPNANS